MVHRNNAENVELSKVQFTNFHIHESVRNLKFALIDIWYKFKHQFSQLLVLLYITNIALISDFVPRFIYNQRKYFNSKHYICSDHY